MNGKRLLSTGIVGAVIVALCCFTPILVVLLGVIGLSAALGPSPSRAPTSPSKTRQRHYKGVANPPRRWRRWSDPWHPADIATPENHPAAVKSP